MLHLQKEASEGFARIAAQLPGAREPSAMKVPPDHATDNVVTTRAFVGRAFLERAIHTVSVASAMGSRDVREWCAVLGGLS